MTTMSDNPRRLYDNSFEGFLREDENAILGLLCDRYHGDAHTATREAWKGEISNMRALVIRLDHDGRIIFEYDIPRLGKRIDVVLLLRGIIFCLEFKVGESQILEADVDQVLDYALDLKNFHKFSQEHIVVPVLIATKYQKVSSVVQMSVYLYKLHPGTITPIKIRENLWSDNIDFTISVCDSNDEELVKLNKCAAIIISKNFANEFVTLTVEGNMSLCKQCQVSRLLLVRAAPFNFDPINLIKEKISNYVILFKFGSCVDKSIPIMLMNEENKDMKSVFMTDNLLIRDVQEKDMSLRQLIFKSNPYQIQCEIKTILTSKTKIKSDKENYIPIKTLDKYNQKNLVQCLDDSFISMFYIQALLSALFFVDLKKFPQEKVKILVLGAGIGTINYYFDKILKSNVCIDAVELDKNVAEVGMEYFGLNNYKKEKNPNIKWYFKDAKEFILERKETDYYDLIIMDINNTNSIEGISPPPVFFENNIVDKIYNMLKPNGIYIIDLLARSYQSYKKAFSVIDSKFPHILYVDNNEDLNKIHLCFRTKREKVENMQYYADGLKLLSDPEIGNIKDIEASARQFILRFVESSKQKEILDAYTA